MSASYLVLLLVVVAAGVRASPLLEDTGTLTLNRHTRQSPNPDAFNINNERLMCLLEADLGERNKNECDTLASSCTCVPFWQCRDNLSQPGSDGNNLLAVVNVRVNGLACNTVEEVCCENVGNTGTSEPIIGLPNQGFQPICGQRNPDGFGANFQGFIDRQSQYGEFPWMAAVMTSVVDQGSNANFYICGASLIHPSVVLTAAHYVHDKAADQLKVRLGEWNFKEPSEQIPHQDFNVRRILIHPRHNPATLIYDVALLFLENEAILGPTVDTICLPEPLQEFNTTSCYSSGWGKDSFHVEGSYQQILKSVNLPVVSHKNCEAAMKTTRLGPTFNLHRSFMCAGGGQEDTCTGDGGSPLVCPMPSDPSRYVQVGIVAWGIGCGQLGIPGVYADVSHAVSWIQEELQGNFGFDIRAHIRSQSQLS